eukprot:3121025-Pyramimonas_sp.AAC.1
MPSTVSVTSGVTSGVTRSGCTPAASTSPPQCVCNIWCNICVAPGVTKRRPCSDWLDLFQVEGELRASKGALASCEEQLVTARRAVEAMEGHLLRSRNDHLEAQSEAKSKQKVP